MAAPRALNLARETPWFSRRPAGRLMRGAAPSDTGSAVARHPTHTSPSAGHATAALISPFSQFATSEAPHNPRVGAPVEVIQGQRGGPAGPNGAGRRPFRLPTDLFSSDDERGDGTDDLANLVAGGDDAGVSGLPAVEAPAMGRTMAAAIAAAEDRWGAEKRRLEAELGWMRAQKAEDTRVLQQTAALVGMLQESHRALVASNQRLLAQLSEEKARHELEVAEHARQFEELKSLVPETGGANPRPAPSACAHDAKGNPRGGTRGGTRQVGVSPGAVRRAAGV